MKVIIVAALVCGHAFGVTAGDVGVFGLASHDLFKWENGRNVENGRLDLSTLFDHDLEQAGERKNSQNALVYSVARSLVEFYKVQRLQGQSHDEARKETVSLFLGLVKDSYERITQEPFPTRGIAGSVANEEQAAMRALHDLLPGHITVRRGLERRSFPVTDYRLARTSLSFVELAQAIAGFDGKYSPEYLKVALPGGRSVNLMESDRIFVESNTSLKLDQLLQELGSRPFAQTTVAPLVRSLFTKGLCTRDNPWLPAAIRCD